VRCAKCRTENPDRLKFCNECGTPFKTPCASCGFENASAAKFCGQCGAALGGVGTTAAAEESDQTQIRLTAAPAPENLEGERKTVTTLFADIKGSMELIEDLDPEEARAIVDPALKLMMEAVYRYGGYVAQSTGDGIFALFGAPVAHEDHAQCALYAALRMQDELKRYSLRIRAEGRLPIQARVGVNTGEVVVRSITTGEGRTEYAPVGHSTGIAARMQALAPVGSIAATEQIRKLCEGYFLFKSLGPTKVKGVSEPVNVFEVTGLGPLRTRLQRSAARGYTKFVGREREIEALRCAAEQARAGRGQIVAVVAEPGVGKSRLFHEFKARNQSGWMVLEAPAVAYGKASAFLPLIELLRNYFKITSDDDERTRREKVAGKIAILDRLLEDSLPYLYGLLGLGDIQIAEVEALTPKRRALDAVKRIILRESLNQPLIVIFEDLHLIDEESQAFLNLLADSIGTARILLLVNYRPEYSHSWISKTYCVQLRLDPLGKEGADEMLTALLGNDAELAPLKRLIGEKTEGNPLFMEEIFLSLLEDGTLERNGSVRLTKPLTSLRVPATVQGILASRIDQLPTDEKDLLQTLAVIGTEFQFGVAQALCDRSDDDLNRMLTDLQLAEFVYEQPAAGAVEYKFKHALTHEVAYRSLLSERRHELHERAGNRIESLCADNLGDHVSQLAHHFTESGNTAKAVQYLLLAGRQALERSAFADSQTQLQKGLEWVKRIPDDTERSKLELELLLSSEETIRYARGVGSPEVDAIIRRADELCERVGTVAQRFSILVGMRDVLVSIGDYESAIEKLRLALELAERAHDTEMLQTAAAFSGITLYMAGKLDEALQQSGRALELTRLIQGRRSLLSLRAEWIARSMVANSLLLLGFPDQARRAAGEALADARQVTLPTAQLATQGITSVYLNLRMPKVARGFAEEGLAAAERSGFGFVRAMWQGRLGCAIAQEGNPGQGLAMIREALSELNAATQPQSSIRPKQFFGDRLGGLLVSLIEALSLAGRYHEVIEECEAFCQQSNLPRTFLANAYLLKGEAILGLDPFATDRAETCFRKAIEIAKGQSAKWWELRATTGLARLLRNTNRRDEARTMLADIYHWFTEGFDTADLKDAKALLGELNS
jgi:class 3 adenylate cyclase/tetratricopeptide (TPR) repeat protein